MEWCRFCQTDGPNYFPINTYVYSRSMKGRETCIEYLAFSERWRKGDCCWCWNPWIYTHIPSWTSSPAPPHHGYSSSSSFSFDTHQKFGNFWLNVHFSFLGFSRFGLLMPFFIRSKLNALVVFLSFRYVEKCHSGVWWNAKVGYGVWLWMLRFCPVWLMRK